MKKTCTFKGLALALFFALIGSGVSAQVFWSETFADQVTATTNWVNGGTNAGSEVWTWTTDPLAGFQNPAVPAFASATVSDGYFYFNSDANGDGNAHDVTLTNLNKPADCSGKTGVKLKFHYQYADYNATAKAYVGVSTDGMNFSYQEVLAAIPGDNIAEDDLTVDIPDADNAPQVWIQFRWVGNWEYHWKIDDVELSATPGAVPCDQNPMAIICDNIDSYNTAQRIGPQADHWDTWSGNEGGAEDGIVSTEQAASAPNSMKIISTSAQGGPQDVMLLLGNKTTGRYELKFKIYVPAGKNGYYNVQQTFPVGAGDWNLNVFFNNNGAGQITDGANAPLANFTYPHDQWFECRHVFDLDNNLASYYMNGVFVKKTAYARDLGGIDFYGTNNISTFYVDDVEYVELTPIVFDVDVCSGAIDITSYFGQAPDVPQTTGLYDNTTATADPSDPTVTCWSENITGQTDIVNTSMWYTFTGDGGKYHIETVPCNATNYIGTAQNDPGDTQMLIYSGNDCASLTPVACNDDLFTSGQPDWRAGLDLETTNGTNYYMLIDGFQSNNIVATGEFCIEITQVPSVTCADGVVGTYELANNGFVCDQQGTGEILTLDEPSFVLPNIGPVYGVVWAISTAPLTPGSTDWPPNAVSYWGSFGVSPSLYIPNLVNDGDPLDQAAIWYFTPVVVAGAVDTVPSTAAAFMHELNLDNACFFVGESAQMILMPPVDDLNAMVATTQVTTPPGNNGTIALTVTGGLFDVTQDPASYIVSWTGPGSFISFDEDLTGLAAGDYTAVITDISGCVPDITVTVSVTTPTTDPKSVKSLTVSPNPTRDAILLNLTLEETADVRIEVVNMLGQIVETKDAGKVNSLSLPMAMGKYADGTYTLRITAGNETALRRIVVQR